MYLIVGLGNPGERYAHTYHNLGYMCVDILAERLNSRFEKGECRALTAHARVNGEKVILAKPITYMNLSGESVAELIRKYKIEKEKFLVIYDDFEIPSGSVRIRSKGSAGTHNGMKSIVKLCGTSDIYRIRIGAGPVIQGYDIADFVLSTIGKDREPIIMPALTHAAHAAEAFAKATSIERVMGDFNLRVQDSLE